MLRRIEYTALVPGTATSRLVDLASSSPYRPVSNIGMLWLHRIPTLSSGTLIFSTVGRVPKCKSKTARHHLMADQEQ